MPLRFSIGRLMALTGVVAANLAVVAASTRVFDLIVAIHLCGPILVCVQIALYRSAVGRRARRPFRLGFAAAGTVAAAALFWAYFLHMPSQLALLGVYASFWDEVGRVAPVLNRLPSYHEGLGIAAFALYYFVPQALLALAGGVLADRLARGGGETTVLDGAVAPEPPPDPASGVPGDCRKSPTSPHVAGTGMARTSA